MAKKKESTKKESASIIDRERVAKYRVAKDVKTASGRRAVDCDDAVARELRGKDDAALEAVAKKRGLTERWQGWQKLNAGQRRMALGNALRALARADKAEKPKKKAA